MESSDTSEGVRADLWLWAARFFRSRTLAQQALVGGKIDVNGTCCRAGRRLRAGDVLEISRGTERIECTVLVVDRKRGSATVAQQMYRESERSIAAREWALAKRLAAGPGDGSPPGRPDKHARKALRAIRFLND